MRHLLPTITVFLLIVSSASAEFLLNIPGTQRTCATRGQTYSGTEVGQTAFGRSRVVDPDTGLVYCHILTGTVAEGFVQDVYIQQSISYVTFQGGDASASLGGVPARTDPLSVGTGGSTTANPGRVIIRQLLHDDEITVDFIKDKYGGKPIIAQKITTPEIINAFVADMRNSTYSDMTTQGDVTWSVQLLGPGGFAYDSSQVQVSDVTAGMYKYNPTGVASGAGGAYTYSDGGYSQQEA
jgi:hypothetical protein